MVESETLSDQAQTLLQKSDDRRESHWKHDIESMFEDVLYRTLEEVLTRKFQEVGFVASNAHSKGHRVNETQNSQRRNVRSWTAGQVVRALEQHHSSVSNSDHVAPSIACSERSALSPPCHGQFDFESILPSCTETCESVVFGCGQSRPGQVPQHIVESAPAVFVSYSEDLEAIAPKDHMNRAPSSRTSRVPDSALLDVTSEKVFGITASAAPKVGHALASTGHVPKAWDERSDAALRFAKARSSVASQSWLSLASDSAQQMSNVPSRFTRKAMSQRLPASFEDSSYVRLLCASVVMHQRFDFAAGLVIVANAASMGVSADMQAKHLSEGEPQSLMVLEKIFFALFLAELLLRLNVHRCQFFHGPGCGWNIFDLIVVGSQLFEEILASVGSGSQTFGLTGVLRLLRLVRVIRLARILRLIRELRVLVASISNSLKSLVWTLILMFLIIYSVSLCITLLVTDKRASVEAAGGKELKELSVYYGSLSRSMLSSFEAITGGLDWDDVVMPLLEEVHPLLALVFVAYIAVSLLAIMNVVTGVFVDSVLASARADKEQFLLTNAKQLFDTPEQEMDWNTFKGKMETPQMLEFFKGIDVDPSEAKDIFALIDSDQSGSINAEEFFNGCVRLHGPSKGIETAVMLQELRSLRQDLFRLEKSTLKPQTV